MAKYCRGAARRAAVAIIGVVWLLSLFAFALSVWLHFDAKVEEFVRERDGEQYLNELRVLLTVLCVGALVVNTVGLWGAIWPSRAALCLFIVIVGFVVFMEAAGIALAYIYQSSIRRIVDDAFLDILHRKYGLNAAYTRFIDRLQDEMDCCGVKSYRDWLQSAWSRGTWSRAEIGIGADTVGRVPRTCCNFAGLNQFPFDCGLAFDKLELWAYEWALRSTGCGEAIWRGAVRRVNDFSWLIAIVLGSQFSCICAAAALHVALDRPAEVEHPPDHGYTVQPLYESVVGRRQTPQQKRKNSRPRSYRPPDLFHSVEEMNSIF